MSLGEVRSRPHVDRLARVMCKARAMGLSPSCETVRSSSTKPEAADSCAGDRKFTRSSGRSRADAPYVGGEKVMPQLEPVWR